MQNLTDRYCLSCCSFAFWFRINSSISFSTAAAIVSFYKITHLLENWLVFYFITNLSISIMNTFQKVQTNFWFAIKFTDLYFELTCHVFIFLKSFALWRDTVIITSYLQKFVWFFTSVKDFEPCSNGVYSNPCFPLFVYIIWCTVKQFFTFLVGLCYKYSKLGYSVYTLALITDTKGFNICQ